MFQLLKNSPLLTTSCAVVLLLAVPSCKKEEVSTDTQAQLNQVTLMLKTHNSLANSAVLTGNANQEKASGLVDQTIDDRCGAVTAIPADLFSFPKTLTFDYGTGCTDGLGIARAGSFEVQLQKLWEAGATSSIQFNNYSENNVLTNGSLAFANTSTPLGFGFALNATSLKRKEATGEETTVQSALAFQQTAGAITFWNWDDDAYEITGTASYELSTGASATLTIVGPVTKANNCAWYSKGTATVVLNGQTMSVDFGNGTCDNEATVTIDGNTYVIYL